MIDLSWLRGVDIDLLQKSCPTYPTFFADLKRLLAGEYSHHSFLIDYNLTVPNLYDGLSVPFEEVPLLLGVPSRSPYFHAALRYRLEVGQ